MGHELAHGTQGPAVSHALLFLVGDRNPEGAGGRQIDDGSIRGRAADVHHNSVATTDSPYGATKNTTIRGARTDYLLLY